MDKVQDDYIIDETRKSNTKLKGSKNSTYTEQTLIGEYSSIESKVNSTILPKPSL